MAIRLMPFYTLVLRPYVEQEISAEGWRFLFSSCDPHRNYDGEIMVFGAMNGRDIDAVIKSLTSYGYVGPDNGDASDLVVWDGLSGPVSYMPDWLTVVDVTFFDDAQPQCKAWKLANSGAYRLIDFDRQIEAPTKGYQCDWAPLIGKIK